MTPPLSLRSSSSSPLFSQNSQFSQPSSCTPLCRSHNNIPSGYGTPYEECSLENLTDSSSSSDEDNTTHATSTTAVKILKRKSEEEEEFEPQKKVKNTSFDPTKKVEAPAFKTLWEGDAECITASMNLNLNRYTDIFPYDLYLYAPREYCTQNKTIKLRRYYLNASKISLICGNEKFSYIASQAPLKRAKDHYDLGKVDDSCHFNEFWKALIAGQTKTIVNLTMLGSKNKPKADDYWSQYYWDVQKEYVVTNGNEILGKIEKFEEDKIIEFSEINNERIVQRKFKFIPSDESGNIQIFTQYHYENWDDYAIPKDWDLVEKFLELMLDRVDTSETKEGPPLVHCSAGIGRTGTIMTLFYIWKLIRAQIKNNQTLNVDPVQTIENQRVFRKGMVQTPEQYQFIFDLIRRYGKRLKKEEFNKIELKV